PPTPTLLPYTPLFRSSPDADYAHLQSGVILGIQRKYPEAAVELDQVIRNFPRSRYLDESLFERAQLFFEQGNYEGAVTEFSKIVDRKSTRLNSSYGSI